MKARMVVMNEGLTPRALDVLQFESLV